jgi:hypothetical protein
VTVARFSALLLLPLAQRQVLAAGEVVWDFLRANPTAKSLTGLRAVTHHPAVLCVAESPHVRRLLQRLFFGKAATSSATEGAQATTPADSAATTEATSSRESAVNTAAATDDRGGGCAEREHGSADDDAAPLPHDEAAQAVTPLSTKWIRVMRDGDATAPHADCFFFKRVRRLVGWSCGVVLALIAVRLALLVLLVLVYRGVVVQCAAACGGSCCWFAVW